MENSPVLSSHMIEMPISSVTHESHARLKSRWNVPLMRLLESSQVFRLGSFRPKLARKSNTEPHISGLDASQT